MQKVIFPAILFLFTAGGAKAQQPGDLLNRWSARSPIEKIYLHLDRESYVAGETLWFKAYLYSDHLPDTISTVLYVELLNEESVMISRKVLPVFLGNTNGQVELPDSLTTGTYTIRAYTVTMLNHDHDFLYRRSIAIYGKKQAMVSARQHKVTRIEFFPEGGNLISGVVNTVAFRATDESGYPVPVSGEIRNERDEKVVDFSSYHDGMGLFEITPLTQQQYSVRLNVPSAGTALLPPAVEHGLAVTIIPHPQGSFFEIRQPVPAGNNRVAYMIGQVQHHVVFRQELSLKKNELQGVIDTRSLPSGILQVTFFSNQGLPLAERLCFVNNREYIQPAELLTDTVSFTERGRNRFSIMMKDTVQGNFSVSVTDADYAQVPATDNIVARLLLVSDLKGYVHNPAWYFSAVNDSVSMAMDLVMMTNGWRRFKWTELPAVESAALAYNDPRYIALAGKVTLRDVSKPFAEKELIAFVSAGDSARTVQTISTDKQGYFHLDSLLFFGKGRVMFNDNRGRKGLYIDIHPGADSLTRHYTLPSAKDSMSWLFGVYTATDHRWQLEYERLLSANGLMLEGITVTARKKNPQQLVEDEYTRGAFSGEARKVFDLVNTDDGENYRSVFHFLEAKGFLPNSRNMPTISALGDINTTIYLDEFPVDIDLELLPMNKIALIKVFSTFSGEWGNGPGGVIAIYTKKGENIYEKALKGDVITYQGFSIIKEFYAPDYRMPVKNPGADDRITLDWRPDIFINSINPKIPFSFYNNDRTKRFRIVVEGMTITGKMLFIEKTVGSEQRGF